MISLIDLFYLARIFLFFSFRSMEEGKIVRKEKQQNDEIGVPRNTKLLQLKRKICDGQRAVCGFCEITHLFCCCWDSVLNMFWASLTLYTVLEIDSQILSKPKTCSITTTLFFSTWVTYVILVVAERHLVHAELEVLVAALFIAKLPFEFGYFFLELWRV